MPGPDTSPAAVGGAPFSFSALDEWENGPVTPAVAAAEEPALLEAIAAARARGLVEPILVGDRDALQARGVPGDPRLAGARIIHQPTPARCAACAVALVAGGEADMLMKGRVETSELLHAVLDRETGLRSGSVLSHLAIFEIDGFPRPLGVTDAAMNIAPGLETKKDIIRNAVGFFHRLGYGEPRVAALAAKEAVSERMPATRDAAALAAAGRTGEITGCIVDGPFALDNAVSPAAARTKGIASVVAGAADILIVPQIESGNVLYKALAFLAPSRHAGVIVGARAPIVLTSRADSHQAKLDSIALAAYAAAGARAGSQPT